MRYFGGMDLADIAQVLDLNLVDGTPYLFSFKASTSTASVPSARQGGAARGAAAGDEGAVKLFMTL